MAYSQGVWFVETSVFSGQLYEQLPDDDYRSLYPKNQQANLRPNQLKQLKQAIEEDLQ